MKKGMYAWSLGITIVVIGILTVLAWSWLPKRVREVRPENIVDATALYGEMDTLNRMLRETGLEQELRKQGPFTLFAPTDQAFQRLPEDTWANWRSDWQHLLLIGILKHHVVLGRYTLNDIAKMTTLTTLAGQTINVSTRRRAVMVGEAKVVRADIECTNGIIHVVDSVVLPWAGPSEAEGR